MSEPSLDLDTVEMLTIDDLGEAITISWDAYSITGVLSVFYRSPNLDRATVFMEGVIEPFGPPRNAKVTRRARSQARHAG